jgi:hypothetical protein
MFPSGSFLATRHVSDSSEKVRHWQSSRFWKIIACRLQITPALRDELSNHYYSIGH